MRAHQIMTTHVITIRPDTLLRDAALLMLERHISGLPVVDSLGKLVGILSEGDFLRRSEIGTQTKRSRWLSWIVAPGRTADEFVHQHGRKAGEVMTPEPITVELDTPLEEIVCLMEKNNIKRIPVMQHGRLSGIVTRTDLLRAVADLDRFVPDPTADDDHIRGRVIRSIAKYDWSPASFNVLVRNGVVHIDGVITDERSRQATMVAAENIEGVKVVHDHLCWVDPMSGLCVLSREDRQSSTLS